MLREEASRNRVMDNGLTITINIEDLQPRNIVASSVVISLLDEDSLSMLGQSRICEVYDAPSRDPIPVPPGHTRTRSQRIRECAPRGVNEIWGVYRATEILINLIGPEPQLDCNGRARWQVYGASATPFQMLMTSRTQRHQTSRVVPVDLYNSGRIGG